MRTEVDGKLHDAGSGQFELTIKMSVAEHTLQIAKPKSDSFGNGLSGISAEEHSLLSNFRKQIESSMWKILHLIDHKIVDTWSSISSEPHLRQDIVDYIHHIVSAKLHLPSLVLTERFKDLLFLIDTEEDVAALLQINLLRHIAGRIQMGIGATLDAGINFSPDHVSTDILGSVVTLLDLWPEMHSEVVKIDLKGQFVVTFAFEPGREVLFVLLLA